MPSRLRGPGLAPVARSIVGVSAMAFGTALYSLGQGYMAVFTTEGVPLFLTAAAGYLVLLAVGSSLVVADIVEGVGARTRVMKEKGSSPLSPGGLVPYLLATGRYRRVFWGATVLYALFYAWVTGVLVYQPGVDYSLGGTPIPSAQLAACCGGALTTPVVSVYLTSHSGILLVPLTMILLVSVSALVGMNSAFAVFAYDSRAGGGKGVAGALGATVGLFTGCPTCAGLFFANVLGGSGAVTLTGLVSYYQPVFIMLSIPVLLVTPLLTSRSLSRIFRDGCVYLRK